MPTVITLIYPASGEKAFNYDYYTSVHMPLVVKKWGDKGLISWFVAKLDEKSGYVTNCTMIWESAEHFQKAFTTDGEEIRDDVPNFSAAAATAYVGTEIAKG